MDQYHHGDQPVTNITTVSTAAERRMPSEMAPQWALLMLVCIGLAGCGGGGGGDSPAPVTEPAQAPSPPAAPSSTVISGKATYARVPHDPFRNGLLYAFTYDAPIRGAVIELIARDGSTLQSTTTSDEGDYSFTANANQIVSVRIKAQLQSGNTPSWSMKVVDNTNGGALYALSTDVFTTSGEAMARDVSAPSGWTGRAYTEERAAAPFAILDTVYTSLMDVVKVNTTANFPPLELNWSINNRPSTGSFVNGEIGSSLFMPSGGGRKIYIMGAANVDTDEYDEHVIAHEFAHYLHYHFGRADSVGGTHSVGDRLDPRVAFAEGMASAFAAMFLKDPNYIDTLGFDQRGGVSNNIESNTTRNRGWYNEGSVQTILYDLYDADIDESDRLELGFAPLYDTLTGPLRSGVSFVTIHSYIDSFKSRNASIADVIDDMAASQNVHTFDSDAYGVGETNSAARFDKVLPIYTELPLDGSEVNVCTIAGRLAFGTRNKLGNRRFLKFTVTNPLPNVVTVISAFGPPGSDPDLVLHRDGIVQSSMTNAPVTERLRRIFTDGSYVLEVYDYSNTTDQPMGDVCFALSVSTE